MKPVLSSIIKNIVLVGLLAFTLANYRYDFISWHELLALQCVAGLVYIFFSCYEYLNLSYKASLPVQRYPYFSSSFVMFRGIKTGFFTLFAVILYLSNDKSQWLYPICVIIAATEAIITWLRFRNDLCFVNIYANYLLISQNSMSKLFAQEIMIVEYRHDIFYFVKKDRKTVMIKLDHIRNREAFLQGMNEWIIRNQVNISAESSSKIREQISIF